MESVYSYTCANSKLEPGQGVELSAVGMILEVEKMQQQECQEIQRQIKRAKQMAEDLQEVNDDKSEDWTPTKGVFLLGCMCFRGGGKSNIFVEPVFIIVYISAKGASKVVGKRKRDQTKRHAIIQPTTSGNHERPRRSST